MLLQVTPELVSPDPAVCLCSGLTHLTWNPKGTSGLCMPPQPPLSIPPLGTMPSCYSLNLPVYFHLRVFAPIIPFALKVVPSVFIWIPCYSFRVPPLKDLLCPHHLSQCLPQDPLPTRPHLTQDPLPQDPPPIGPHLPQDPPPIGPHLPQDPLP